MYGEPKDVDGECNARLSIADDAGDGSGTMRCQLETGHEGSHREVYNRLIVSYDDEPMSEAGAEVVVTWYGCEREERQKWDTKYAAEYGPYCESCHTDHHGPCSVEDGSEDG